MESLPAEILTEILQWTTSSPAYYIGHRDPIAYDKCMTPVCRAVCSTWRDCLPHDPRVPEMFAELIGAAGYAALITLTPTNALIDVMIGAITCTRLHIVELLTL